MGRMTAQLSAGAHPARKPDLTSQRPRVLYPRVRNLALTTITAGSAALLAALAATGASAATTVAATPGHVTAPRTLTATACVDRTFGPGNTYQPCVDDLQVLLNDLWYVQADGPNQLLTTDGYYGRHTASEVASFHWWHDAVGGRDATPSTWKALCAEDSIYGFHGAYWVNAGCAD